MHGYPMNYLNYENAQRKYRHRPNISENLPGWMWPSSPGRRHRRSGGPLVRNRPAFKNNLMPGWLSGARWNVGADRRSIEPARMGTSGIVVSNTNDSWRQPQHWHQSREQNQPPHALEKHLKNDFEMSDCKRQYTKFKRCRFHQDCIPASPSWSACPWKL